jgi:hypothetical protein
MALNTSVSILQALLGPFYIRWLLAQGTAKLPRCDWRAFSYVAWILAVTGRYYDVLQPTTYKY